MAIRVEVSQDIDRPVAAVFKFFADDHVRNHPRWDPYIQLWQEQDEPIGVGALIHRRNSRSGVAVEGTMQVVEYEPERALGMITREGPMEVMGRAMFDEVAGDKTRLTLIADISLDESMKDPITGSMRQSLQNIKDLVEEEL